MNFQWELGIWLLIQYNEILLCLYSRPLYLHNYIQSKDSSFVIGSFIFRIFICILFVLQKERNWIATNSVGQDHLEGGAVGRNQVQGVSLLHENQAANSWAESKTNTLH